MEKQNSFSDESNSSPETTRGSNLAFWTSVGLRALAAGACVASSWTTLTNHETALVFGLVSMVAKYSFVPSLKLLAYGNMIAGVLAVVSLCALLVVVKVHKKKMTHNAYFFLFLHDLVLMTVVMAASSAATAEGNVGRFGNRHSGWAPICGYMGRFCSRAIVSVAHSYTAFFLFLALTVLSAFSARA